MSSFKFYLVSFLIILVNENLFCNGEPGLYLSPYRSNYGSNCECIPKTSEYERPISQQTRTKRNALIYNQHQQPGYLVPQATYPLVTSGAQPVTNYQPVANTIQQPMAYQLQPVQQRYYSQPLTTQTGLLRPAATLVQPSTYPATRYIQPQQQVQYVQPKPTQHVEYIQKKPIEQVEYVQPATSRLVKLTKPQKLINKSENYVPTAQIATSNAQPIKYTIPTAPITQQSYYSIPATSYPQTYSVPETGYSTYPQGYSIPETGYSTYPQGYSIPQGYSVPEISYPQSYPMPETTYPQGYPVPEASYPQTYPISSFYPVDQAHSELVQGPNYIETTPKYLFQDSRSGIYPYGNPNVQIYPRGNLNQAVFQLKNKVDTPTGEVDVELIDVMPYRPGTEPVMKIPRVSSIETIIKPKKTSGEEADLEPIDNNSIEKTTKNVFSIFK